MAGAVNAGGETYREITLYAEYLDRPIFEPAAMLLHETAHLYNLVTASET